MATYDAVRDLPVEIDSYELEPREAKASPDVRPQDDGRPPARRGPRGHRRGRHVLGRGPGGAPGRGIDAPAGGQPHAGRLLASLDRLALFPSGPGMDAFLDYRRWAYESAALDLALRQAGLSLADAGGVRGAAGHVRGLTPPRRPADQRSDPAPAEGLPGAPLQARPDERLDGGLVRELAARGAVDTLDLKGAYKGTPVDQPGDPDLYRLVAEAFPSAWIEDPDLNESTDPVLEPLPRPHHLGRADPLRGRHRGPPLPAADDQLQAVALRQRPAALRGLRLLRGAGHRDLRRRPVGARPGPRADPVPRLALPR